LCEERIVKVIITLAVASLMVLGACSALAQSASLSGPLRIIVPYAAGGLVDVMSRIMATRMAQALGQPVIVENRPGANANIGPAYVVQAPADGRVLLASASYFSTNPLIEKNLQWTPKQLMPVARFAISPNVFVVPGKASVLTLADFLGQAKAAPGMPVMDAGPGATQTMVQMILEDTAQVTFTHIPYRGGVAYVADIIGGTLRGGVIPLNVALGLVKSGDMKALAITSAKRSDLLPEVATMAESGFPDAGVNSWLGYHVPAGTPPDVVKKLTAAVQDAAADPEVRALFSKLGAETAYLDTAAFQLFLADDLKRAQRVVRLLTPERR
jgi:tripartite-type tricarboxylate transporter receptor subunit TctC